MPPEDFETHTCTYLKVGVFIEWLQKYVWGPSGLCSSGFRNTCGALVDYAVVFVEWFQKYVWGPSGLCSSLC